MTKSIKTQLVVLGCGPGGYTAAFCAADLGLNVTLVERFPILGGVCLNVGCIPSKALLHVAKVLDEAKAMENHGVAFGKPKIDIKKVADWKNSVSPLLLWDAIDQLAERVQDLDTLTIPAVTMEMTGMEE